MRIAYDPQIFYNQKFGGISRYFARTASKIASMGSAAAVFAPIGFNAYLDDVATPILEASILAQCLKRLPRRLQRRRPIFMSPLVGYEIRSRMARWNPDIVHETYFHPRGFAPSRIPVVLTVYDMIHELFPGDFPDVDPTSRFKRNAVNRADAVICISHSTARDLTRLLDIPASKVHVVHLGWDEFARDREASEVPSSGTRPFFLYVGARAGYKNFGALLEALRRSPDLTKNFDLIAFGGGEFNKSELATISRNGLEGKVHYIEGDDHRLSSLYSSAHAFVYPSLYEGFGLPPLEAMACDCPVVSSNTSSMPEVIGNAGLLFDPNDIDEIASSLKRVAEDEMLRRTLINNGQKRLENFSWARCAEETLGIYRGLAK